jgi:predicted MPP superfamily phosphohydrolase
MKALLAKSGIEVVENKVLKIKGLTLAGLQDYSTCPFDRKAMNLFLKENRPPIVLTHKGEILKYAAKTPDFTVFAADTHGGQVRLPWIGSLYHLRFRQPELPTGISNQWGKKLFITSGAGGHRLNFRVLCPPEIAVVTFTGKDKI